MFDRAIGPESFPLMGNVSMSWSMIWKRVGGLQSGAIQAALRCHLLPNRVRFAAHPCAFLRNVVLPENAAIYL